MPPHRDYFFMLIPPARGEGKCRRRFFPSGTCTFGQGFRPRELILVVAAGGGVSRLILTARVGIDALFKSDEVVQKLERN